jgi:hypothetical protein
MSTLPGIAYLHALGDGGPRSRTQVVVIHATDSTASAHDEASYATHREDQTSAHFYVDAGGIYEALQLENVAFGCLWHGNQISVQFELCGRSNQLPDAVLRKAAPYVAEVCRRFGIPVRKISAGQVAAGVKGICGHADITAAFPQDGGDHTDPGSAFPWGTFIGYVNGGGQPAPAPQPQQWEEPDMILVQVDKATVPAGSSWPGVFLMDGSCQLHHITPAQKRNGSTALSDNVAGYEAAGLKLGTITYAEYLARTSATG